MSLCDLGDDNAPNFHPPGYFDLTMLAKIRWLTKVEGGRAAPPSGSGPRRTPLLFVLTAMLGQPMIRGPWSWIRSSRREIMAGRRKSVSWCLRRRLKSYFQANASNCTRERNWLRPEHCWTRAPFSPPAAFCPFTCYAMQRCVVRFGIGNPKGLRSLMGAKWQRFWRKVASHQRTPIRLGHSS